MPGNVGLGSFGLGAKLVRRFSLLGYITGCQLSCWIYLEPVYWIG